MMSSWRTFLLKRRSALSSVSPSWSFTSANCHLQHSRRSLSFDSRPRPILLLSSDGLVRLPGCLDPIQLFGQFLAGPEGRIPLSCDRDGLSGPRVAALPRLAFLYHEAAKS